MYTRKLPPPSSLRNSTHPYSLLSCPPSQFTMSPAIALTSLSTHSVALAGLTLHLAKGFGRPRPKTNSNSGPESGPDDATAGMPSRKDMKAARRNLLPCNTCAGKGKKPCQFCDGTTLMVGFLGTRVPCVPCQGKGTLGRPCPECGGMGFFKS